jgi:hypothetical protein
MIKSYKLQRGDFLIIDAHDYRRRTFYTHLISTDIPVKQQVYRKVRFVII